MRGNVRIFAISYYTKSQTCDKLIYNAYRREDEDMEELKMSRKHFSKLGGMFIIGTIVIYAVQLGVGVAAGLLKPEWLYDPNISLLVSMLPMYLVGMPVLILLVRRLPAETVEKHEMRPGQFIVALIMTFGIMYAMNFLGTMITTVIGTLKGSEVQNLVAEIATSTNIVVVFIFMVICAPVMEEYIFRKLIVDRTVRYGQGVAVLLSGLMFGLFHGNLNQFIYAFAMGVFLAFLYVKTGKLKITIAIHMAVNFMGGVVSSQLLKAINLNEYMEIVSRGMDMDRLIPYMMEHLAGWIGYLLLCIFIFGCVIAAGVLLIVFLIQKRFALNPGTIVIPQGKKFRTFFLNLGMIIYCVFWIGMILVQLFFT